MNGSEDRVDDHGSREPGGPQDDAGSQHRHSGHGAASALARFKSQQREQEGGQAGDAAGGHGQ